MLSLWEELIISYFYSGSQKEEELNPSELIQSGNSRGTTCTRRI